jgi:2-hydroxychromene-2-carboxylate isomerase
MAASVTFVFFDYTCPYSWRLSRLLDGAGIAGVRWRPFLLAEHNRTGGAGPVWEQPEATSRVSVLALALHEAVISAGADADGFRRATFAAFSDGRVTAGALVGLAEDFALQVDEAVLARSLRAVAAHHEAARAAGVFGTPTVVANNGLLGYVKLAAVPEQPDECRRVSAHVISAVGDMPEVTEIKRPRPP